METTLSSQPATHREPVGAQRPLEEQVAAVNSHADAPTLTDQVSDGLAADLVQAATTAGKALKDAFAGSDEWLDAGRTVVRANPLLALGGAALIGLALSLATSRAARR